MKIIDQSPHRLILHRKNWTVFLFLGIWTCGALAVSGYILWQEWPQFWQTSFVLVLPLISLIAIWFPWWQVTARFDRSADEITVETRRLIGIHRQTRRLSDLREIGFDTEIDSDATVHLDFGSDAKTLKLPVRSNGTVAAIAAALRQWCGLAPTS